VPSLALDPLVGPLVVSVVSGLLALALAVVLGRSVVRRRRSGAATPAPRHRDDVRVLRRQVDVLTAALAEWESTPRSPAAPAPAAQAHSSAPEASRPTEPAEPAPAPAPEPAPVVLDRRDQCPTRAAGAFADLSRRLAAEGDLVGAVQAQWASDLQSVGPHLGERGAQLRDLIADLDGDDPRRTLLACREAALHLVDRAGGVRTLLGPTDHLTRPVERGEDADPLPGDGVLRPALVAVLEARP